MGLLKDWKQLNGGFRLRYQIVPLFSPKEWIRLIKWRRQRAERGWSDRDVWGGGEHIISVSMGVLRSLHNDGKIVDWDDYFKNNAWETYGYKNLEEVAQDLDNYLYWCENEFNDEYDYLGFDAQFDIGIALHANAVTAMRFVADNIHGLWW